MAINAYDTCPCGSGKKFKWCCHPYFDKVERALDLHQQGQHESSLRVMEDVTKEFPAQPQVWGYYANLLNAEGHTDKAEEAVSKALELDPNFGMGHLLRGIFRQQEGEVIGALLLFRKAAETYDVAAADQLVQVYEMIARNEILLNRPVAGRAALERAVHFSPGDAELREQFEAMFGPDARLPEAARKKYVFRPTAKPVAVETAATGKLSDAKKAFEALTKQVPDDPAAWYDLGVVRAWLGEQPAAVEALNKSLELEWDDAKAEETAALIEVLKCGQGMENESDYIEHRVYMQVRDPQVVFNLLQQWANERRIIAPQADPNTGYFSCLVAEELPSLLDTGTTMARVTANLTIAGGLLRLWHPDQASVQKVATNIRDRVNLAVGEPSAGTGPAQFGDIVLEALAYPTQTADIAAAETKLRDHARHYFEDVWSHRPLRSLGGATPLDAAGSKLLRKRLLGVIKFLEQCVAGAAPRKQAGNAVVPMDVYDFHQLRHKLGGGVASPRRIAEDSRPGGRQAGPGEAGLRGDERGRPRRGAGRPTGDDRIGRRHAGGPEAGREGVGRGVRQGRGGEAGRPGEAGPLPAVRVPDRRGDGRGGFGHRDPSRGRGGEVRRRTQRRQARERVRGSEGPVARPPGRGGRGRGGVRGADRPQPGRAEVLRHRDRGDAQREAGGEGAALRRTGAGEGAVERQP